MRFAFASIVPSGPAETCKQKKKEKKEKMGKEIVSSIRGNSSSEEKENGTHFPTFPFAIFHGVGVAAFDPRWAELICISIQLDAHTTLLHRCIIASIGIKQWKRIFLHFSISPFLFFSLFFFCLVFVFLCFRTDHHVTRKWMDNREWISRLRHRSGERRGREGGRKGGKGGSGLVFTMFYTTE